MGEGVKVVFVNMSTQLARWSCKYTIWLCAGRPAGRLITSLSHSLKNADTCPPCKLTRKLTNIAVSKAADRRSFPPPFLLMRISHVSLKRSRSAIGRITVWIGVCPKYFGPKKSKSGADLSYCGRSITFLCFDNQTVSSPERNYKEARRRSRSLLPYWFLLAQRTWSGVKLSLRELGRIFPTKTRNYKLWKMPKLLNFRFPVGRYFFHCKKNWMKKSSKIFYSVSERHRRALVG